MDKKPIVDIAVACSAHQVPDWWSPIMGMLLHTERTGEIKIGSIRTVSSALPDQNKNSTIGQQKKRWSLTDANRNKIINSGFLLGGADWIFWMDDDTVPPENVIEHLIKLGLPFVAGLYFLPAKPYNPIAYKRHKNSGLYAPVYKYPKGGLFEVDSVGMGCTLIHRSVYEKIKENHTVFEKYNGAIIPVHNDQVHNPIITEHKKRKPPYVRAGIYREQVIPQREDDDRNFPFYLLEYGRTEDHHFCELSESVGIKPFIDTTVTCEHYKHKATTVEDYDNEVAEEEGLQ
jgi:hypothetical protein